MTDSEILTYLRLSDTIDLATIERQIMAKKKETILKQHTGKIWQGKNGRWYTYVPIDGPKKRRLITSPTREALEDSIVDNYEESYTPTFDMLFQEWIVRKLEGQEICRGTFDRYCEDYRRYFTDEPFAHRKIKTITENDIEDLVRDKIVKHKMKRKTYANLRTILLGVFKYAKRRKYTDISISAFFGDLELSKRMFRKERRVDEKQVFRDDEVRVLIPYLKEHPDMYNLAVALDFYTGVRAGELAALRYSDFDGETLHVQRQQIKYKGEDGLYRYEIVDYTKSDAGDRHIYLPRTAVTLIKEIHMMNPSVDDLFPDAVKTNFTSRLRRACKACNIEPRSLHKVRKTYGTMLLDNGVEESLIMQQMGHSDINTTRQYYYFARKDNEAKQKQIEQAVSF